MTWLRSIATSISGTIALLVLAVVRPRRIGRILAWASDRNRESSTRALATLATESPGAMIDALRQAAGAQDTPFYPVVVFHDTAQVAKEYGSRPTRVLEIGPGCSLATLACFIADGATRAVGVDIQPADNREDAYYEECGRYLAVTAGFGWWHFMTEQKTLLQIEYDAWTPELFRECVGRVEYCAPVASHEMPFSEHSFDFIYSNAVLEHIEKTEETVREIRRVLEPGGLTVQGIDLRDHDSKDWLEFLSYDEDEWLRMTTQYGDGKGIDRLLDGSWDSRVYCNRLRISDWAALFERNRFEILSLDTIAAVKTPDIRPDRFAPPFSSASVEDLAPIIIRVVARAV